MAANTTVVPGGPRLVLGLPKVTRGAMATSMIRLGKLPPMARVLGQRPPQQQQQQAGSTPFLRKLCCCWWTLDPASSRGTPPHPTQSLILTCLSASYPREFTLRVVSAFTKAVRPLIWRCPPPGSPMATARLGGGGKSLGGGGVSICSHPLPLLQSTQCSISNIHANLLSSLLFIVAIYPYLLSKMRKLTSYCMNCW